MPATPVRLSFRRRGADQLGAVHGPLVAGGEGGDRRLARRGRARRAVGQLPAPRLGLLPAALLGLPDPDHPLSRARRGTGSRRGPAGAPARARRLPAEGRGAARLQRGVDGGRPARSAAARRGASPTRWTRSSTRRGTSCATATRTTAEAPFDREIVDYWGPVDFYQGGVDHATVHMIYARFFHEGARRSRARRLPRAVRPLPRQRLGPARRDEDVEVEGQCDRSRRVRGRVRRRPGPALHPVHRPRRAGHGVHRLRARGHAALRPPAVADRERGRRDGARGRRRDEPARPEGPRDDRARHRRHRPAGVVQHARSRP